MKLKNFFVLLSGFFVCLFISKGFAQITIDNSKTPDKLITDVLIPAGSGTSISNVKHKGVYVNSTKSQFGTFTTSGNTKTQLGFSNGIVLTSGYSSSIPGNSSSDVSNSWSSCSICGCNDEVRSSGTCPTIINDVKVLVGSGAKYLNAVVLEFDFIPVTNSVQFRYVFSSEEYTVGSNYGYNCSDYNDKFGFIISGPGISGGEGYDDDGRNIARLANGSLVSINSVNNGQVGSSGGAPDKSKCQTANPNWVLGSASSEYQGAISGIIFNGNTKILTASQTGLIPGQTYHIKLIISDVTDGAFDSAVFLEAGSFTTEPTDISAGPDQTVCKDTTTLNAINPLIGTWTVIAGSGVFANDKDPKTKVSGLQLGVNKFVWTSTADGKKDTVQITYTNNPVDISYSPNVIATSLLNKVAVTQSGVSNGTYTVSPSGLIINSSTGEITPNGSDPGTYVVEVNTPCGKDTAVVTIVSTACGKIGFDWNPSPPSSNDLSCSNNADYGLKADNILTAIEYIAPGFTIKTDGSVSITGVEIDENNTGFQNAFANKIITYCVPTYNYKIKISGTGTGNIWLEDHATKVKYLLTPFSNNMILDIPIGSIKGKSVFYGKGVRNERLGKASTFVGSGYGIFNPSSAGPGIHTIYYSWDNGLGCSGVDSIKVTVSGVANNPNIVKDTLTFCTTSGITADTLYKLFSPTMVWYDLSQGGLELAKTIALQDGKIYYASEKSGACESSVRDSVVVVLKEVVKPAVESNNVSFCIADFKTLADLNVDGTDIKWYNKSKGGTALPLNTLLDSITYYVSQTIGVCESVERDSVNVKLRDSDKPTLKNPGITLPLVFCSFPRPIVDTLKNYVIGNNLKYYTDSVKGKAISAQDSLKTGTYYISQKPEGKCESSKRLAISVVIGDTSQPNLSQDTLFFCPSSSPTVSNLSPLNSNLIWYDVLVSGVALGSNTVLTSGKMYYASQIGKTCESSLRDSVLVIFKSPETPQGSTTAKFCASAKPKVSDLTPKGSNIKWYLFSIGTDSLDVNFPLENGRTYYAANKVGDCESSRLDVTVTLEDPKATLSINSKTAVCEGKEATIEIENPQQGTTYNVYSNFNSNTAVGTAPYTFTPKNDTIYYIQASNSNGCVQANKTPILIRVNKNPNAPTAIASNLKVCKSTALILNATSGQPNVSFSWTGPNNFKSTDAKVTVTSTPDSTFDGNYYVSVIDKNTGCVSLKNDTVSVEVIDVQAGFIPSSKIGFIPAKLAFTNTSVNATSFYWNFKDGSESKEVSPEHVFEKEGVYQVYLVAYRENCRDTAYMGDLEIGRPSRISVPNVFTPNDDNVNDVFNIKGDGLKYVSAKIFNRWGQLVYEWENLGGGWNGTTLSGVNAPDGTYFYFITAKGNDSIPYTLKGYVDLIR